MRTLILFFAMISLSCATTTPSQPTKVSKIESRYAAALKFSDKKCQQQQDCPKGTYCMNEKPKLARCVEKLKGPEQVFEFPFAAGTQVYCTQSYGNLEGTHGWASAFYALDLATPYAGPPGKVTAAAAGTAYVSVACPNPTEHPSKTSFDRCGNGWGNNVRIDHGGGLISLYSHLSSVAVKTGDKVEAKQFLGTEGASGAAGHRHLHFDIQQIPGDQEIWTEVLNLPDVNGLSVPFKVRAVVAGRPTVVDSSDVHCPWREIDQRKIWVAP